jgi:hypothetical protein
MTNPNISALLQQLSPSSWAGSTSSFSFVSGNGTSTGGGATRLRLVRTDEYGSQAKCQHRIGACNDPTTEKVCMADKMSGAETCGTRHQGNEVALEADALYIRISRTHILGIRFIPCVILADDFVDELLNEAKELAEWQTLFAEVIRASENSDDTTLDAEHFNRWQQSINMSL